MIVRRRSGGLVFSSAVLAAVLMGELSSAFAPPMTTTPTPTPTRAASRVAESVRQRPLWSTGPLFMGMNRKARRQSKKKQRANISRPLETFLAEEKETEQQGGTVGVKEPSGITGGGEQGGRTIKPGDEIPVADAKGGGPPQKSKLEMEESGERVQSKSAGTGESVTSAASVSDAPVTPDQQQPDVSTIVVDPETGIERIQQGKYVMDKTTRKAVKLSDAGPEARLAQMFPGVPPDVREKYRFDWSTITVPEMVDRLRDACTVPLKNQRTGEEFEGIPPHPQVSDPAVDFVLANRDYLGHRMKKALGRLKLRAQSQFQVEEARSLRQLWKHFLLLEDHISAPFRQMMLDAEARVGPNFGNLDMNSYCAGDVYERAANYLILKSMVAHWEKKVADAEFVENTPDTDENFLDVLYTGDPKRYLPDPPIIFRLNEVTRITLMAQKMTKAFVDEPELFDDLPPEVRFVEKALSIKGGTALRKFVIEEFCPAEGIDPAALREGMRRLYQQMYNMQIDPYGDLTMTLWNLCVAMGVGTTDAREPYSEYIGNVGTDFGSNPGFFQTYTFDHDKNSLVRFLDSAKKIESGTAGPAEDVAKQISNEARTLLGIQVDTKEEEDGTYQVPEDRAIGRPHMMGWLDILGEDEEMTGGRENAEEEKFEADNWETVE